MHKIPPPLSPAESAAHYDEFYGPLFFEPYAIEVARRINPVNVHLALEIAAGTGRVTRHIRERLLPGARLIASDLDASMLAVAQKKSYKLPVEWQEIDAQQLPFADKSIDLVVCCFGYMFVEDKSKAFSEAFRVLKPGGHLIFTTWDKLEQNSASFISRQVALTYLDVPPPASADIPTSMHDEKIIAELLQGAGFNKISINRISLVSSVATAKDAANGFTTGGVIYEPIRKKDPAVMEEVRATLEKELGKQLGVAPMLTPISAILSEAWKQE